MRGTHLFATLLLVFALTSVMESRIARAHPSPILTIGDSHTVGPFGRKLYHLLRTLPDTQVASYGVWGSTTYAWLSGSQIQSSDFFNPYTSIYRLLNGRIQRGHGGRGTHTPIVSNLLHQIQPRLTIVELGANDFAHQVPLSTFKDRALRIATEIHASGSQCIWVGPPNGRNKPAAQLDTFYRALRAAVVDSGYCKLIDSRSYTRYPSVSGDGAHYNQYLLPDGVHLAHRWARSVFQEIQRYIRSGITR